MDIMNSASNLADLSLSVMAADSDSAKNANVPYDTGGAGICLPSAISGFICPWRMTYPNICTHKASHSVTRNQKRA